MDKEIKITVPDGYEIDKENSTFDCIKFKKKALTYKDVVRKMCLGKRTHYVCGNGSFSSFVMTDEHSWHDPNIATNTNQLNRMLYFNMLMTVAEYLNDGWKPNFDKSNEPKYYIYMDSNKKLCTDYRATTASVDVLFKTEKLAMQAIEILGEDVIKGAMGVY